MRDAKQKKAVFAPDVLKSVKSDRLLPKDSHLPGKYACPCCGFRTLPAPACDALAFICPVCCWEIDTFLQSEDEPSDQNHGLTLRQARENFRRCGAVLERLCTHTRAPSAEELP